MGLDASVGCTCYQEGRTSPPPVPRALISFDDDGWLDLSLPDGSDDQWWQVHVWAKDACEHRDMQAADVRVSNWADYRAFQQALARVGWDRFPTLRDELPNVNGGSMSGAAAARALDELAAFRDLPDLGHEWYLVDGDTGDILHTYIASYDGTFIYDGRSGVDVGFDPRGLFVVSRTQPPRELFRAMRIEQRPLVAEPAGEGGDAGPVELVDLDTGRRWACPTVIAAGRVRRLQVERRAVTAAAYEYVLRPLEEVFRAAVATGNPVRWS